ncbi:MAG TPA: Pr6Pr family membrane protein [Xanthobacteraceae bacterium]|nr:Pr6Pr family membrane protein [Xanthobacteraceae bacterium]
MQYADAMKPTLRPLALLIALLAWAALALQFVLVLHYSAAAGRSLLDALARYFSFFTILTNLLVAALLTGALVSRDPDSLFKRVSVQSAAVVYILVVMLIYFLLLRGSWTPHGTQFIADTLLHYVVPPLYALYWLAGVPKGRLAWSDPLRWLAWPSVYFFYNLALGAARGEYPYRFIDPGALGYPRTFLNGVMLAIVFLALGLALVAVDRAMGKDARLRL